MYYTPSRKGGVTGYVTSPKNQSSAQQPSWHHFNMIHSDTFWQKLIKNMLLISGVIAGGWWIGGG
jgi:hypothetical protein